MLTLLLSLAAASAPQRVRLEVVAPAPMAEMRVQARAAWAGEDRTLELLDDGSGGDREAADGVWTGLWEGPPVQALALELVVTDRQGTHPAWAGTEVIRRPDDALSWALHLGPPLRAVRTAMPAPVARVAREESVQVVAAIGWAVVVLNVLGWLALPLLRRRG